MENPNRNCGCKAIFDPKKPWLWILLAAVLCCIAAVVCILLLPKKSKPVSAEFVGRWEFYKLIADTFEEDVPIETMLGDTKNVLIFNEDGSGMECRVINEVTRENPFTYTVSGNKVFITRTGRDKKPVEFTYDPESGMLRSPEDAGEGSRWYTLFVREGSITYPTVQLTNEQIAGEWITDGIAVTKGRPLTLSGALTLDADGIASMHLNGDADTEMQINGTFISDGSIIRFMPDGEVLPLSYYSWFDDGLLLSLEIQDIRTDDTDRILASYEPQSDTIRFVVTGFGVLTFRRATPARSAVVMQWLDYQDSLDKLSWEETKELTLDAFPNVTFRWTGGAVGAVENGETRTLFCGMPVVSVYVADVTGDGKPDFCASVYFGSGVVDEHVVVYDYAAKQSYTLWDRMNFDFHLYAVDGVLYVGKTPYGGDKQSDSGTLEMRDGALVYRSVTDGSFTPLFPELHESELFGEWLVQEEKINDETALYHLTLDLWKEYNFKEDGTVIYNETVPISSDSELAFGHPVAYPYTVYNDRVYVDIDNASGFFRWGSYDRETGTLHLSYDTPDGTADVTLSRMDGPSEESDFTQEQADAFVNGLSVKMIDGHPYGCDLVCFLDGYGMCIDVGEEHAAESASLRFHFLSFSERDVQRYQYHSQITYSAYLYIGNQRFCVGLLEATAPQGQFTYIFSPFYGDCVIIDPDPVRLGAVDFDPLRAGVIRSFDAEKREVTVSFAELINDEDGFPYIPNDSIQLGQITLRVTDDTLLALLAYTFSDCRVLTTPDGFFRMLEKDDSYQYQQDGWRGNGFYIGYDGDTLLYLCELYEP